jgi:hypothetical protein
VKVVSGTAAAYTGGYLGVNAVNGAATFQNLTVT